MQHPGPDELTLAALPAEPVQPGVAAHLSVCAVCRTEVAALRRTVDLARTDPTVDGGPPPRVWQAILAEVASGPAAPVRRRRTAWRRLLVPVTTVAAGLVAGLAVAVTASLPPPPPEPLAQIPLAPLTAGEPAASGTARVVAADGARDVVVEVEQPAGPPAGGYLEAWLMSPDATRLYSLGALTREPEGTGYRATVRLPPDLSLATYPTVDVSAEPLDGDPGHSGRSLLRGRAG